MKKSDFKNSPFAKMLRENAKIETEKEASAEAKPEAYTEAKKEASAEVKPEAYTEAKKGVSAEVKLEAYTDRFSDLIASIGISKSKFEESRKKQNFWLSFDTIDLLDHIAKKTGKPKYEIIEIALEELNKKLFH